MNSSQHTWSRRKFIATSAGAGTIMLLNPSIAWAFDNTDPKVATIVAKTMGIDAHNHVDVPLNVEELPGPKLDLSGEMKKSGLSVITIAFAVDYQQLKSPGVAYERFINGLTATDNVLSENNMIRALTLADLKAAKKNNTPTVIQSVEGGHFLEGQIERLEIAYKRGLRHLTLLHDNDALVPLGDVFTNPAQFGGLTAFGTEVIKECNRLGILIDLSHGTNDMVNAALKITTKPVIVSHTGLNTQLGQNENMAKMMKPRLISKEQAKIVANTGGVIGVWTHLSDTPLEYAQNIRAMVDVAGIDHVCIGTDTKLTPAYRSPNDKGHPGSPGPQQVGNNGERKDGPTVGGANKATNGDKNKNKMGGGTNQAWADQKDGFYYTVVDALLKTGFNEKDIAKIGGDNYCRVFDAATRG